MSIRRQLRFRGLMTLGYLIIILGCASVPGALNPSTPGPQVTVTPETIRLGVAKLTATNIVFEGSGFKPGDSLFITLSGPKETKVIAAEGQVQPDGTFKAPVSSLTKVMEILRGDVRFNEKFQNVVVITQPPIPTGVYTIRVKSLFSDRTAESKITVAGPTVIDRLKDWIGSLTGKIEYKKRK